MEEQYTPWYDLLDQLIAREGFSRPQVARRSGVHTKTITSWLRGDVQSPREWRPLVKVMRSLRATPDEANQILEGAGHLSIHKLAARTSEDGRVLLAEWLRPSVPFMPPDRLITALIGRQTELLQATKALQRQRRCVLLGMAGIGKTTLAIELAHQLRHDYPDGVFWGNLRTGMADTVLESWGQACGVNMERLTDFDSRAAAMRSVFSRKQALIILDDVVDSQVAQQIMPPQNLNCAVLVTTRSEDVLRTLTRRQPGMEVRLEPMSRQQSLELLGSILGEIALTEEKKAAEQVAGLLGDMPLALHICAALCDDASLTLTQMAVLLRELRTRLEHLRLDEKPLVRLAFEQSWMLLDKQSQYGLAMLAVFAGRPFHTSDFAATAELSGPEAALALTKFCRRSLLTMTKTAEGDDTPQFYQHTLLAAFAAEKLADDDLVWDRFSNYYGRLVSAPDWWQTASQETWGNVIGGMAAAHQLQAWPLLLTYAHYLTEAWRRRGLYSLARQGYELALDAVRETADLHAEAAIRLDWGRACLEQSDYVPAREQLTQALTLFTAQKRTTGIAESNYHLSRVEMEQSQHDAAEAAVQRAYHAYQQEEDVRGMARALYRLGFIVYFRGDYERAASLVGDAIRSQQRAEDKLGLLRSHRLAVQVFLQLGRIEEADRHCRVASQLVEQLDDRPETAAFYYVYADVLRKQKAFPAACTNAQKALTLFREMADGSSEANALLLLAGNELNWNEAEPQRQRFEDGLSYCRTGLAVCEAVGYELGRAFLLLVNGRLLAQKGETAIACATWVQAMAIARTLQHDWLQKRLQTLIDEAYCASSPPPNLPLDLFLDP